jgi:hypothetical protein
MPRLHLDGQEVLVLLRTGHRANNKDRFYGFLTIT